MNSRYDIKYINICIRKRINNILWKYVNFDNKVLKDWFLI